MIDLNFKQLKALLLTAGKKDVRYYINGVFLEVRPDFHRLVSTDGSNFGMFHNAVETDCAAFDMIIPRKVIEDLPKQTGATVKLERHDANTYRLGSLLFTPIDGKYPEYRRVIPKTPTGVVSHHTAESLVIFAKIADTMVKRGAHVRLWHNGDDGRR